MPQLKINYYYRFRRKDLYFFFFLWILLYIEPITINSFKISQIWKAIAVFSAFMYLLPKSKPIFYIFGMLYALKYLFYTKMPYGYITAVQNSLESMIFPLALIYLYNKYKYRKDAVERLIHTSITLSLFIIISTIPFIFGLQTLNPVTELDQFGLEDVTATKGLFYHIAVSSKMFTIATLVLINFYSRFSNNVSNKLIWLISVTLGSWYVFTSWTRTGWFIFLFALLISFFYNASLKKKIIALFFTVILFLGVTWLYDNNQAVRYRLTGGATYRTENDLSLEQLANARLPFIIIAIDNITESTTLSKIFGYGTQHGIDLFEQKTGMKIVSHNATFEILESSGIIGLVLYMLFIGALIYKVKSNWKYLSLEIKRIVFVSGFLFIGFYLTSHGTPFWGEIIFACYISLTIISPKVKIFSASKNENN
ncbi:MAG: hypothetical protein BGP01_11680 [Paludibacter sp. 47-17]|nr:MAG: hypothetical protein BGP01_11680 [Paludibacter sp. 47-17]